VLQWNGVVTVSGNGLHSNVTAIFEFVFGIDRFVCRFGLVRALLCSLGQVGGQMLNQIRHLFYFQASRDWMSSA
jgi:hypothetical protein